MRPLIFRKKRDLEEEIQEEEMHQKQELERLERERIQALPPEERPANGPTPQSPQYYDHFWGKCWICKGDIIEKRHINSMFKWNTQYIQNPYGQMVPTQVLEKQHPPGANWHNINIRNDRPNGIETINHEALIHDSCLDGLPKANAKLDDESKEIKT